MLLFPIAILWLIGVMIWIIRASLNDGAPPQQESEARRWHPRPPQLPRGRKPSGSRARSRSAR